MAVLRFRHHLVILAEKSVESLGDILSASILLDEHTFVDF